MSAHDLLHAADGGNLELVKQLVEGGLDVNKQWQKKDGRGYNPLGNALHYSSRSGHLDVVKYLVENGADLNTTDIEKWTALHYCCNNGHEEIVEYLLSKGIDTSIKDTYLNQTAIQFAVYRQFGRVVKLIDPTQPESKRSKAKIEKNAIKPVFKRNSKKFLFRYSFEDRTAADQLMQFRKDANHAPLTVSAFDEELASIPVTLTFNHDFEAHRALAQELRAVGKLVRSSTLSTCEHMCVAKKE